MRFSETMTGRLNTLASRTRRGSRHFAVHHGAGRTCRRVCVAFFAMLAAAAAAEPQVSWLTGRDFLERLEQPIGFRWDSNPLRDGLRSLSQRQQVAIWLDRRVDPGVKVNFSVESAPFSVALSQLADSFRAGVGRVGPVIYLGPPDVAAKIATIAALKREQVQALPAAARGRFERLQSWQWDELAEPRELLQQLARAGSFTVTNSEQVPHDLWAASDLPPLSLSDRLTLLLAGFNLTFDIERDGSAIRLVPLPESAVWERTYPAGSMTPDFLARLAEEFPSGSLRRSGNQVTIAGTFEMHEAIARRMRGEPARKKEARGGGEKRYDLRFTNQPLAAAVKLLAEREGLTVQVEPSVRTRLEQRVSLDVQQATLHELLQQLLEPFGIAYRLEGKSLQLRPAE